MDYKYNTISGFFKHTAAEWTQNAGGKGKRVRVFDSAAGNGQTVGS